MNSNKHSPNVICSEPGYFSQDWDQAMS